MGPHALLLQTQGRSRETGPETTARAEAGFRDTHVHSGNTVPAKTRPQQSSRRGLLPGAFTAPPRPRFLRLLQARARQGHRLHPFPRLLCSFAPGPPWLTFRDQHRQGCGFPGQARGP